MKREWKPGDVAMVGSTVMIRVSEDQCYVSGGAHQRGDHWHGGTVEYRGTLADQKARPVAVIDPEDREAVERLRFMIADLVSPSQLREALDHYLDPKPPKPEEPTGLGAVVEDADGIKWVHIGNGWWQCAGLKPKRWDNLDVVDADDVLNDGVQA